jgi:DNA recombination protein RmuC
MENAQIYFISVFAALLAVIIFLIYLSGKFRGKLRDIETSLKSTQDLKSTIDVIAGIHGKIGEIANESRKLSVIDKDIGELKNLFLMPSQAGTAGQTLLDKALTDILGANFFQSQYPLKNGRVDYVLKFKDCLIPVDSKLSLESYKKMLSAETDSLKRPHWKAFQSDVKRRIEETSKYISPSERTTDFAFMYIASESVYYEAFIRPQHFGEQNTLFEYAMKKKVFPVSPQTIVPFLNTIVMGLKALKIEDAARDICNKISALRNDFDKFQSVYSTARNHLQMAQNRFAEGSERAARIKSQLEGLEIEPEKSEKNL